MRKTSYAVLPAYKAEAVEECLKKKDNDINDSPTVARKVSFKQEEEVITEPPKKEVESIPCIRNEDHDFRKYHVSVPTHENSPFENDIKSSQEKQHRNNQDMKITMCTDGNDMKQHTPSEARKEKLKKKHRFFDYLSIVLSLFYGIFIVILSLGLNITDLIVPNSFESHNTEVLKIYLSSIGIILLLWLIFDIEKYICKIKDIGEENKKDIPEYYGFTRSRHAGSFFLKIGVAFFCFGHLIDMVQYENSKDRH